MLTETWLNANIADAELFGNEFNVFRCDRTVSNSSKPSGGGVLIAVRSNIPSRRVVVIDSDALEFVFVCLSVGNMSIYIACIYIPPASSADYFAKVTQTLSRSFSIASNNEALCFGDFNLSQIEWFPSDDGSIMLTPINIRQSYVVDLIDMILNSGLVQINNIRNF